MEDVITFTVDYNSYFLLDSKQTQAVDYYYAKSEIQLENEAFNWIWP